MTDFSVMTDKELDHAAAEAMEPIVERWDYHGKTTSVSSGGCWACPTGRNGVRFIEQRQPHCHPSTDLNDAKRLAGALGIELYGEIAHESGSRRRTYEMTAYRGDIDSSPKAKSPARAATVATLAVDEKRKEQT